MGDAGKPDGVAGGFVDLSTLPSELDDRRLPGRVQGLLRHSRGAVLLARAELGMLARSKVDAPLLDRVEALSRTLRREQAAWLGVARGPAALALRFEEAELGHADLRSGLRTFAGHDAETQRQLVEIGQADSYDDLIEDLDRLLALGDKHHADLEGTNVDADRRAEIRASRDNLASALEQEGVQVGRPLTAEQRALRRSRNRVFHALWAQAGVLVERMRHGFRHDAEKLARVEALPSPRYTRGSRDADAVDSGDDGDAGDAGGVGASGAGAGKDAAPGAG